MTIERSGDGHHCHALGCKAACKPEWLMCYPHWRMVPRAIQNRVYATYRDGQCDDMNVSLPWIDAAKAAIRAVAEAERVNQELIEWEMRSWDGFADAIRSTAEEPA